MFCIVAFVVLSILGIFSASNRVLAREAMDCVLRRVTLRPCNTGFDEKMKAKILGVVITRSEGAAIFLNKYFEAIAWVFFVLLLASSIFAVRGVYLFYVTGSCNGLNSTAFCVFDPNGNNNQITSVSSNCYVKPPTEQDLTLEGVDTSSFPVINKTAKDDQIFFIGCYACDYTRAAYPMIREIVNKYTDVNFIFADYPVKEKTDYLSKVGYCVNKASPDKFWKLNDELFATDKANLDQTAYVDKLMTDLGLDAASINTCVADPQTEKTVQNQFTELKKTKFFGTPTIFINGEAFVGPKPYRVYAIKLKGLLYFLQ
jgi:protein-disulfide isomerase